jgi:hypothetical protein
MSDFLTNLAARTLGAPTLRPRLRSRFEPAPVTGGIALESAPPRLSPGRAARADATAEMPRRMTVDAAPPARTATPQRQHSPAPNETKQPVDDDHIALPVSADIVAGNPPQPAPPPERRTVAATTTPISSSRSTPQPPPVLTDSIHESLSGPFVETREIIVREPAAPGDATATPQPTRPRHRYDEQPPRIERTVVSREMHFASAAPRSARAPQSRMEVPAQSEPVIQVSIGRVEVRAVTPPPAAKANRTPRAAAMTIDDYAARRNAKGRR